MIPVSRQIVCMETEISRLEHVLAALHADRAAASAAVAHGLNDRVCAYQIHIDEMRAVLATLRLTQRKDTK